MKQKCKIIVYGSKIFFELKISNGQLFTLISILKDQILKENNKKKRKNRIK